MQIIHSEFLKSANGMQGFYQDAVPEIAVVGRSNVGKSSFINALTSNAKLAKTSSLPGRTRLVNYFSINHNLFRLVDLPGYGFAKASKAEQEKWNGLMQAYFTQSKQLKMVVLLVDIRHEPTEKDVQMLEYLYYYNVSTTIVATKCDKVPKSKILHYIKVIMTKLKVGKENIFPFSSETKYGKEAVLKRLDQFIFPDASRAEEE